MDDLYALLGLESTASAEQIRKAHRKLAVRRHRAGVLELQDELERLNRAFEVLSDPARRRAYDAERELRTVRAAKPEDPMQETVRARRDGKILRRYAGEIAEQALRRGEEALAESAPLVDDLAREHEANELARIAADRRRELVRRGVEAGVFVLVVLLAVVAARHFGWVH